MDEQLLIRQAKEGVSSCFSQLVKLYQARLYQYLLARCHSSYDAEDILQETFINAYKYTHSYRPKWQFSTWLFTIANRLIKKQHTLYYKDSFVEESESTKNAMASIDRNNFWIQVKAIVNPQAYDVLWFFYIEELSLTEIAKILQRSKSWVKISLFRSKKQLAKNRKIKNLSKDFFMQGILL